MVRAVSLSASKFLLADHSGNPPDPVAKFGVHSSADGLDFSRNSKFGHEGEAFILKAAVEPRLEMEPVDHL